MNANVLLMIASLFYLVLIASLYFSKKNINNFETKIYKYILIIAIIGVILDLIGVYASLYIADTSIIRWIVLKLYYSYLLTMIYLLSSYMFITGKTKKLEKSESKKFNFFTIVFSIVVIINFILPVNYYKKDNIIYAYGLSTNFLYFVAGTVIFIWLCYLIKNFKNIRTKKNMPMITFVILVAPIIYLQMTNPEFLLMSGLVSFIVVMMYHTIENPDTKMIEELNQNRILIEKTNEDKSNFLFRMAQEVKQPIDDIIRANNIMKETENKEMIQNGIKYIDYNAKNLKSIVNNVLGVSSIDSYNIKMSSNEYDVNNLFLELISKYSNQTSNKVEFRSKISSSIPKKLYGDGVKLKQVIATILENAIHYTKEGFIDFNVDAITKNDVCRLIISVEDSGIGMSIDKVNQLLSIDQELTNEDAKTLDQVNLNLNIATKVIKLLGGHIIIKSEENKGSEFIIVVEQKVKEEIAKEDSKIEEYSKILSKNKRILLVDDSKEFINEITKELKKYNVEIVTTMYGNDCIEKIRTKQKFDLILIDDDMTPDTGLATLQQLQQIAKFKTPVIVMLEKNKESIKEHYINDGFKDYLLKYELETDTKRIAKKYL